MQAQSFEAIYVDGVIKPLHELKDVLERSKLNVTITSLQEENGSCLEFAGILNDEEAKEMIEIINEEFGKIEINGW